MTASGFEGRVALVAGGGNPVGAAVARSLAARGVSVVVTGPDEHALAMVVCEVANAAGKARHLAGDLADATHVAATLEKLRASFGAAPSIVVSTEGPTSFAAAVAEAAGTVTSLVLVGDETVAIDAAALANAGFPCHAVVGGAEGGPVLSPEDAAEVVVLACMPAAQALRGSVLRLRGAVAS
ncbi:MAG TPA: SDR family NAD(P)-dependent oxidoreductase [Polyangiaceae bacterium]